VTKYFRNCILQSLLCIAGMGREKIIEKSFKVKSNKKQTSKSLQTFQIDQTIHSPWNLKDI
jgi:hypothetical protein